MIETTETVNAWIPLVLVGASLLGGLIFTKFAKKLQNKKIGIIGLAGSGKTTLAEYLANHSLPEETSQTLFAKDYEKRTLADLGMTVCITDSVSNHTEYDYAKEKEILRVSDIILYLFDMSKFFTEERDKYFKRINKEIRVYSGEFKNLQNQSREKIFIALGTFKDYIQDSVDRGDMTIDEFNLKLAKIREDFIELFENFSGTIYWQIQYLNSLANYDSANEMVKEIFGALKEHYG
ncbi:hypothetical protein R83H12_02999 [Fibrobacteria bacterium R8-3-H12]